jgi:hypothetical protein
MLIKKKTRGADVRMGAMAEVGLYPAYILRGIVYLPHYKDKLFVSPGYGLTHWNTYQGIELKALGGQLTKLSLFKRPAFEEYSQ